MCDRFCRHAGWGVSVRSCWFLVAVVCFLQAVPLVAQRCEALDQFLLPNGKIMFAVVAGGKSQATNSTRAPSSDVTPFEGLPAFCRVSIELHPSPDSAIQVEVWMPLSGWNGRLRGVGNSGFGGSIEYGGMRNALVGGFASVATDTGHKGNAVDASWAPGHPEKVIDFGYRSVHEMTVAAKTLVRAFYGTAPRFSYFAGCSGGGRQALMEAQRYPGDYNGILAGAPGNNWTHLFAGGIWDLQASQAPSSFIAPSQLAIIAAAVLKKCDQRDGVQDGILTQPDKCNFEPRSLLCRDGTASDCLTADQVDALTKIYSGPQTKDKTKVFPGYMPGGEEGPNGWANWITGAAPGKNLQSLFALAFFRYMVYEDPHWNYKQFDFTRDMLMVDEKFGQTLNAVNPNLTAFQSMGSKLILYHGWSDPAIPTESTIDYYQTVAAYVGQEKIKSFARLYLVPGMQHCSGGPGANSFGQSGGDAPLNAEELNIFQNLEAWVERNAAPGRIVAYKYEGDDASHKVILSRPLCPYPQVPKYKGVGDTTNQSSFECVLP